MASELLPPARVVVVSPTGSDARNITDVLRRNGFVSEAYPTLAVAAQHSGPAVGALVIAEEAIDAAGRDILAATLGRQPAWSDLPVILVTSSRHSPQLGDPRRRIGLYGNVTLIERPLHIATLVATVDVALRSRYRQFQLRDLLAEREKILASLEDRVTERTAKLQAMVTEMEAFSYSVSHDLRSPLRVLAGYAHALREDHAASLDPEAIQYLDKIAGAAERMDRLTQDLLAYTRIAGSELKLAPVDLDDVVLSVLETYPTLRQSRDRIRIASPLGWVCGHAPSLVQCFSNLLDNALKFSKPGESPAVEIASAQLGAVVRCDVSDQGPGIDPADQERIFGLFERATDKRTPGTGVGLAIVKKAVERMKGRVGVESRRGLGTRFWFELKAVSSHERCA